MFSEEGGDKMHRVVVINIYFGSAPCSRTIKSASQNSFSSRPYLQTQLTSKGGQIPGKSDGLINGNAKDVGASVIGAV